MTTGGFLLLGGLLPFTLAASLVLAFVVLELLALVLGGSLAGFLEGAMEAEPDVDAEAPALAWFGIGVIPAFALAIVALSVFALAGYAVQLTALRSVGEILIGTFAVLIALVPTLLLTGPIARFLGRTVFKDETEALSSDELVGGTATITLGETFAGHPTQAKIVDRHKTTHYVLVEPLDLEGRFTTGDSVTLVRRDGHRFLVTGHTSEALFQALDRSKS